MTPRQLFWMRLGWLSVLVLSAALAAFTALDPGGGWWAPWIFVGVAIGTAGNLVWSLSRPST